MACCAAGEIGELKEELANPKMEKKKEAVKKVIAAMTVGKDVVMLFTDVVNCIQTQNIELKKLVYLYLINYAKSQPDLAILAAMLRDGCVRTVIHRIVGLADVPTAIAELEDGHVPGKFVVRPMSDEGTREPNNAPSWSGLNPRQRY